MKRLRAVLAIKENYRWKGVWAVLRAPVPEYVRHNYRHDYPLTPGMKTWQLVLTAPDAVVGWQTGVAEGVFV